ncbi:hypothetical protein H0H81_004782 [Sphagnurus paluster]|uniref:Uncharacterized protein n=1 Tax=Sphagnurus paluster TaxID=117069 RepID=A0A9P7GS85_9AGAR|nr:hypothetical protein H0H81_004782 [Sphagnurus paluster]
MPGTSPWKPSHTTPPALQRPLGPSEFAFFPASHDGLGDMFLHLAFRAPRARVAPARVAAAWAVLRNRHPLLMCEVVVVRDESGGSDGSGYVETPHFRFTPPANRTAALAEARAALHFRTESKDELISNYMNGARTLSDQHLSYLVISASPRSPYAYASTTSTSAGSAPPAAAPAPTNPDPVHDWLQHPPAQGPAPGSVEEAQAQLEGEAEYDLLMCAPHYTGDGTSLHQATHDLLVLLASDASEEVILGGVDLGPTGKGGDGEGGNLALADWASRLPPAFEDRCRVPRTRFARAGAKVSFALTRAGEVGGHAFQRTPAPSTSMQPAPSTKLKPKHKTILWQRVYSAEETRRVLGRCKGRGVTVNHALEAACAGAWGRVVGRRAIEGKEREMYRDPVMMYTAINLRPHLAPLDVVSIREGDEAKRTETYWFLALTYFTLVLPAFPPGYSSSSTTDEAKTTGADAIFWHRARSAKAQSRAATCSPLLVHRALEMAEERAARARGVAQRAVTRESLLTASSALPPAPSTALLGLSLIGNLDAIYVRGCYPGVELREVTTASRQKSGGMLLLVHTFGGRLWMQMFFDEGGFVDGGAEVEAFWEELGRGVEEWMVGGW